MTASTPRVANAALKDDDAHVSQISRVKSIGTGINRCIVRYDIIYRFGVPIYRRLPLRAILNFYMSLSMNCANNLDLLVTPHNTWPVVEK